ncbi:hypothetical protein C8R45DRAFT_431194 [Mycena sanguinolenta]|nr:hypothetical protein C8R45DRAFT_431194 [Mycena sanguinolenta]
MAPGYSGCNLCLRAIPPTDPRVNCLECHEYDLCANCALGAEEFPDGHLATHRTRVFRMSGGGAQAPVVSLSTTIVYQIPEAAQFAAISPPPTAVESLNLVLPELPSKPALSADAPTPQPLSVVYPVDVVEPFAIVEPVCVLQPPEVAQPVAVVELVGAVQSPHVVPQVSPPEPPTFTPPPTPPPPVQPAAVVQRFSPPQSPAPVPPVLPPRQSTITFSPPPRQSMIISSLPPSAYTRSPSAALAALAQAVPAKPEQTANTVFTQTQVPATPPPVAQPSTSEDGVSAYTMPPRDEPPANTPRSPNAPRPTSAAPSAPPSPPPDAWGSFFDADMSPTRVFTELIGAIFTYLDTRRTGNLTPEVYSRFLINQGYVGKQNIWHSNLVASMGKTKEECADAALKRAFDLFGIQYILRTRTREATSPPADVKKQLQSFGASVARAFTPTAPAGGLMPLLTRAGFLGITAIEVLCDPARHYTGLARIVEMYDLGAPVRGWGALPRGVLPDEPDARMLAKIARVQAAARERQPGQVRASAASAAASAAGGLLSAAQTVVNKIDAKETVNAINAAGDALNVVGNAMYIVNSVNSN